MRAFGANAIGFRFDAASIESIPENSILLLRRGHYIVFHSYCKSTKDIDVYDPALGWQIWTAARLVTEATWIGVRVDSIEAGRVEESKPTWNIRASVIALLQGSAGRKLLILTFAAQSISLLIPLMTQIALDSGRLKSFEIISLPLIGYMLISAASSICGTLNSIASRQFGRVLSIHAASELHDRLASISVKSMESRPQAFAFNQLSAALAIHTFYGEFGSAVITILVSTIFGIAVMFYVSPLLILPGLLSLAVTAFIAQAFQNARQVQQSKQLHSQQRVRQLYFDIVSQFPLLRRLGVENRVRTLVRSEMSRLGLVQIASSIISAHQGAITSMVISIERIAYLLIATYFVATSRLTLGAFVAIGIYKDLLLIAVSQLLSLWRANGNLISHRLQLAEISHQIPAAHAVKQLILRASVTLSNVSIRYGELDPQVLRNVTFTINEGEFAVIQGESGSGKTTLLRCLYGDLPVNTGQVYIGDQLINCPVIGAGVLLQGDRIISGSIADNIRFFRSGISDLAVEEVLSKVELLTFVNSLPMKQDTPVGDELSGLSEGQRQRLLLARCLASHPKILFLDEATSALDPQTESVVLTNLRALKITVVLATHRTNAIKFADRCFTVLDGSVIECPLDVYDV